MSQPYPTVDLGYPTAARGRMPAFNSVEDEAAFGDTHDVTDFMDESTPVQLTAAQELAERLTLRLDQAGRQELGKHAREKGIGSSTLARMWLKERLRQEARAKSRSSLARSVFARLKSPYALPENRQCGRDAQFSI